MAPVICLAWTILAIAALLSSNAIAPAAIVVAGLIAATIFNGIGKPALMALNGALPLALPLALVHGVINPAFPAAVHWLGAIPVRPAGLLYASLVSLRVIAILLLGAVWSRVDAERLIAEARAARMPLLLILTLTVAASTLKMISRRIDQVYLAQQARGIASGPGFVARLKALPTVVLPVVTTSLVESAERGDILTIRGLGSSPLPPVSVALPSRSEWFRAAALIPVAIAAIGWP